MDDIDGEDVFVGLGDIVVKLCCQFQQFIGVGNESFLAVVIANFRLLFRNLVWHADIIVTVRKSWHVLIMRHLGMVLLPRLLHLCNTRQSCKHDQRQRYFSSGTCGYPHRISPGVRLPRAPLLCLIFSQSATVCNWPMRITKASDALNLLTFLPPSLEEPAIKVLERGWHQEVIVVVRDRLPKVLVVLFLLFLVQQIIKFLVKRMNRIAMRRGGHALRGTQLRTMATIVRATSYSVLGFIAFLQLLNLLNINYAPLLASAGILGVGIGLGAQSLFKDIINGIFIVVEDQYNVGEMVKIASLTGTVEDLTLRLTRLRDNDGTLYVIPNSQIATVSNLSRDFSVASLPVAVDASANPDTVIELLREIALSVRSDPAFKDIVLEDPKVLGVDKIDGRTIIYPVNLRVAPNQKDEVLRELRRRIVIGFEEHGIPLGSDSSLLIMPQAKDPTAPPSQQPIVGS